ncbi:MAG TPA: GIY-YIG nuclease family protein, partial [Ktedonobacteraceae bacterium]|nr:GIY-YIG nuclease family protein [Ktedonobacteraceae bacterium]
MDSIPQNAPDDCGRDLPAAPGIYAIINRVNQHVYVGSAKSLLHRKQHHFRDLKAGNHKNPHLQRAFNSYGSDAFLFVVLEPVEHVENLLVREQHYIDTLNPEYNIARTAGSNLGVSPSLETRAKMRAARLANEHMPEQMEKLNADRRGKHLSPEHRAKITANQIGKKLLPEHRAKISAAHLGKKKTPEHSANIRAAKL